MTYNIRERLEKSDEKFRDVHDVLQRQVAADLPRGDKADGDAGVLEKRRVGIVRPEIGECQAENCIFSARSRNASATASNG